MGTPSRRRFLAGMFVASATGFRFNNVQAQTAPQAELLGVVTGLVERALETQDAAKAKLWLLKATVVRATNSEFDSEIRRG
jgi:hypothetical protein